MESPILVCAAVADELAAWHPRVSVMDHAAHLRLAGHDVLAVPVGVGPVEAALGAALAMQRFRPRMAILAGTCGAFPGTGLAVGDVVVVESAALTSSDAAAGLSYVPGSPIPATPDPELLGRLRERGLRSAACATAVAITVDPGHVRALAGQGFAVEHLEAAGFLRAAARCAVPAACVLGVANEVGPGAHEAWKANAPAAAAAALAAVEALLAG